MPLHWSLESSANIESNISSKEDEVESGPNKENSNWLLTTKYSSLPRHRGSLRLRHHLRPDTSLPLDVTNGAVGTSNWMSELRSSFKQMPSDAFEKPNKEYRRIQHRKQTALLSNDLGNNNIFRDDGYSNFYLINHVYNIYTILSKEADLLAIINFYS